MSRRGQRTSRIWIVLRFGLAMYAILAVPCLALFLLTGIAIFLSIPALLGAMGGVALLMLIGWVGTKIGGWLLFHDDPEYQQLRQNGFDPYFDNLPWPVNTDSDEVRLTGFEESPMTDWDPNQPSYTDADGLATLPCPSCHQQVKEPWIAAFIDPGVRCWNCQLSMKFCTSCANLVGEPFAGAFGRPEGVQCPFCGKVMRM